MKKQQIQKPQNEKITAKDILNWVMPLIAALINVMTKLI